jgi:hypothetical protein
MATLTEAVTEGSHDDHAVRRSARRRGAVAGLAVATAIAGLETAAGLEPWVDLPIGATGAIPAMLCGWWLGPTAASRTLGDAILSAAAIAIGVVALGDALVVVAMVVGASGVGLADPTTYLAMTWLYLFGLVLVGVPMLMITVPAGVAWLALVRLWTRR